MFSSFTAPQQTYMQLKPAMLHIPTAIAEYVDLVPGLRPLVHNHHIETPLSASAVDKLFKLATLVESSFTESGENKAAASKLKIQAVLMSSETRSYLSGVPANVTCHALCTSLGCNLRHTCTDDKCTHVICMYDHHLDKFDLDFGLGCLCGEMSCEGRHHREGHHDCQALFRKRFEELKEQYARRNADLKDTYERKHANMKMRYDERELEIKCKYDERYHALKHKYTDLKKRYDALRRFH